MISICGDIFGQDLENFSILPIFGVIFGQNLCICHPRVPMYRVPPNFYAIDIEDIALRLNLNVFCGYFVLSNGPNWEDFTIISIFGAIFGTKFGYLTPWGAHL